MAAFERSVIPANTEALFADLALKFAQRLPDRLAELRTEFHRCKASRKYADFQSLNAELHKLKGSTLTFGYQSLGRTLQTLEHWLQPILDASSDGYYRIPPLFEDVLVATTQRVWVVDASINEK